MNIKEKIGLLFCAAIIGLALAPTTNAVSSTIVDENFNNYAGDFNTGWIVSGAGVGFDDANNYMYLTSSTRQYAYREGLNITSDVVTFAATMAANPNGTTYVWIGDANGEGGYNSQFPDGNGYALNVRDGGTGDYLQLARYTNTTKTILINSNAFVAGTQFNLRADRNSDKWWNFWIDDNWIGSYDDSAVDFNSFKFAQLYLNNGTVAPNTEKVQDFNLGTTTNIFKIDFGSNFSDVPPAGWSIGGASWGFIKKYAWTHIFTNGAGTGVKVIDANATTISFSAKLSANTNGASYFSVGDAQGTSGYNSLFPAGHGYALAVRDGGVGNQVQLFCFTIPTASSHSLINSNTFVAGTQFNLRADRNAAKGWTLYVDNNAVGYANTDCDGGFTSFSYAQFYSNQSNISPYNNSVDDINFIADVFMDTTAPVTTIDGNFSNSWGNTNQTITLTCTDTETGCLKTQYKLDGGAWTDYAAPFEISTDLNHEIDFNSIDKNSNIETTHVVYTLLDKTRPVMKSDANASWNLLGDANINLTCTDATSGAKSIGFRADDNNASALNWLGWAAYDTNLLLGNYLGKYDGNFGLQFYCTDNAGNDSNSGAVTDINYVLLEVNSPPTPTLLTPTTGNFTGSVSISCSAPTWIRDRNYYIDYNTNLWDWNVLSNNSTGAYDFSLSIFSSNTNIWFRCKTTDGDKNGSYLTNATNIVATFDTNFDSLTNATPVLPTVASSASLPFSVTASDVNGVNSCTFEIYKNTVFDSNHAGAPTVPSDTNNGVWSYTYTSVVNGDIVFSYVSCSDGLGNISSKISSSTYTASIIPVTNVPSGGGGSAPYVTPVGQANFDLNFSPSKVDQFWLYLPFDSVERSQTTEFNLNQNIVSCTTSNPAFTCSIKDGHRVFVTATYSDDSQFSKLFSANIFGTNAAGRVGKTEINFRVLNLGAYFDVRDFFKVPSDSLGAFTNNALLFKISDGKIVGIRAWLLGAVALVLVIGAGIVFYRTG